MESLAVASHPLQDLNRQGGSGEPPLPSTRTRHPTRQGARGLDPKQFEGFVRQSYLIVSQAAWLNGLRKSEKLPALRQPTSRLRTPKVFASKELSRSAA